MLQAILHGLSLGLIICILVGPVFFALMGITLHYGKKAALGFIMGIFASDLLYALLVYLGISSVHLSHNVKGYMGILGGLVFVGIGLSMVRKTLLKQKQEEKADIHIAKHPHWISFLGQGFLINALNPGVILFWAGAVGTAIATLERRHLVLVFIITTLFTIIATDFIKISLAEKLKSILHGKILFRLHMFTGILLMLIGAGIAIYALFTHHF